MFKKTFKTIRPFLIGILTITVIVQGIVIYQEKNENQKLQEAFFKSFYYELNNTISDIENVSTDDEGTELTYKLNRIDKSLTRTALVMESGHLFLNRGINRSSLEGFFYHQPIMEFAKDGSLSENEKSKLNNIKKALEKVKEDSKEQGQINKKMSIEKFNEIIKENQTLYFK
ncbi:hypothetical protein [Aquisalibacillus elongatus]|uniref:Uncharacterized protein n=1 Tax=Aquisalibacillus elongatus TaxID=485577 RepID=A0A3N5AYD0_9BACI|nr:hypothetical protein [Aquisalibacillus elongatus]RPF50266.1 hypothetical protein EDC24_2700 [Aquisalibacillus elongatus]